MGLLVKDIRKRWPGNCLVYSWGPALTEAEKTRVREAMQDWENTGHVRFMERTTQDRYVTFIPDMDPLDGICSSSTHGMGGGQQFIHLDHDPGKRTLRHEIGHALGFYHEHKRRDRDDFIDVNTAKIQDGHKYQFEKVGVDEALQSGDYDLDSVMHYGDAKKMSRNGETALITTDDPADSDRIGSPDISPGDVEAVELMEKGTQHVYQLSANGQIENMVEQEDWSAGWTIARPYTVGVFKFLLLLKTSNGKMHINRINLDGSIGERIQTEDWSNGWTHAVKYAVLGSNYLMLYKSGSGKIHLHKINGDGKIGEKIDEGTLESGWSYAAAFGIGIGNFMLFSNLNGDVFVHEIEWDGKIGQRKHAQTFGNNYTVTQPFNILGSTFLFMLKSSNGVMKIRRIDFDGRIGDIVQEQNWSSGWTTAIPYHVGVATYLLLLKKDDGSFHINRIEGDGKVGPVVDRRVLASSWETATVYGVGLGTYVILVKR